MVTGLPSPSGASQYRTRDSIVGCGGTKTLKTQTHLGWFYLPLASIKTVVLPGMLEVLQELIYSHHSHTVYGIVVQLSDVGSEHISTIMVADILGHPAINSQGVSGDGDSTAPSTGWGLPLHHCL